MVGVSLVARVRVVRGVKVDNVCKENGRGGHQLSELVKVGHVRLRQLVVVPFKAVHHNGVSALKGALVDNLKVVHIRGNANLQVLLQ